jgi:uncharacterized protein (DUF302 family)
VCQTKGVVISTRGIETAQVITKASPRSVAETAARLTSLVEAKGMKVFAVIDHSGEAERVGLESCATRRWSPLVARLRGRR